eukprot:TRINITY_DN63954_c0_g1_i1.p1 TRINITY_DN63954_c0_g1~~TRINITY_DN63954_c0_g1_i1.p1  ORF type:complete len:719 (-),score=73.48 TRINITY_DN63954_c0_g1_i1:1104-3236(-)
MEDSDNDGNATPLTPQPICELWDSEDYIALFTKEHTVRTQPLEQSDIVVGSYFYFPVNRESFAQVRKKDFLGSLLFKKTSGITESRRRGTPPGQTFTFRGFECRLFLQRYIGCPLSPICTCFCFRLADSTKLPTGDLWDKDGYYREYLVHITTSTKRRKRELLEAQQLQIQQQLLQSQKAAAAGQQPTHILPPTQRDKEPQGVPNSPLPPSGGQGRPVRSGSSSSLTGHSGLVTTPNSQSSQNPFVSPKPEPFTLISVDATPGLVITPEGTAQRRTQMDGPYDKQSAEAHLEALRNSFVRQPPGPPPPQQQGGLFGNNTNNNNSTNASLQTAYGEMAQLQGVLQRQMEQLKDTHKRIAQLQNQTAAQVDATLQAASNFQDTQPPMQQQQQQPFQARQRMTLNTGYRAGGYAGRRRNLAQQQAGTVGPISPMSELTNQMNSSLFMSSPQPGGADVIQFPKPPLSDDQEDDGIMQPRSKLPRQHTNDMLTAIRLDDDQQHSDQFIHKPVNRNQQNQQQRRPPLNVEGFGQHKDPGFGVVPTPPARSPFSTTTTNTWPSPQQQQSGNPNTGSATFGRQVSGMMDEGRGGGSQQFGSGIMMDSADFGSCQGSTVMRQSSTNMDMIFGSGRQDSVDLSQCGSINLDLPPTIAEPVNDWEPAVYVSRNKPAVSSQHQPGTMLPPSGPMGGSGLFPPPPQPMEPSLQCGQLFPPPPR